MRSKALEKSIIQHLIIEPGLSNSASQWWWIRWIRACVIGQFFIFPNWRWSMDDLILLRSQRKTKPSSSLLSTGVREIGLRSLSTDLGLDIFGKGRTSADFQSVRTWLCAMLALKIEVIGPASSNADVFSTQLGMWSGPVAFCKLMFSNPISTWRGDIIYSSGTEEIWSFLNRRGGRLFETLQKNSVIRSASSEPLLNSPLWKMLERGSDLHSPEIDLMLVHHFFGFGSRVLRILLL